MQTVFHSITGSSGCATQAGAAHRGAVRALLTAFVVGAVILPTTSTMAGECQWRVTSHEAPSGQGFAAHTQGGGKIWASTGGACPGGRGIWSFDPWGGFQTGYPETLHLHWGPAMAYLDGLLYVIGGGTDIVERFDPANPEQGWDDGAARLPATKGYASAEVMDGKIYVFGGTNCCGGSANVETYIYDPDADAWAVGPPMCNAGGLRATTVVGECIYAVGGAPDCSSDAVGRQWVERYCLGEEEWECMADFPIRLRESSAVTVGDRVWIVTGRETDSDGIVPSVWTYNTATNGVWVRREDVNQERRNHAVGVFGTGIYLVGGVRQGRPPITSVEHIFNTIDCSCPWDIDSDGQVNPFDAGIVQSNFGAECAVP